MSDAPIPGILRLHMGVLATRFIRPFVISDTVTVYKNNVLVSFKSDGGRAPESTLLLSDTMVGDYRTLKTINLSQPVTVPTIVQGVTDTPTTLPEGIYQLSYSETIPRAAVPPTITDTPEFTVSALNTIILLVPTETIDWDATPPVMIDTVTMVRLNSYQPVLSETLASHPTISLTDTVNTLLT